MSGQKDNDKQISDEKEEAVLSPLNDAQKFRFEEDILAISKRIRLLRGNPLLIMYYPDNMGRIVDEDIATVYEQFRRRGFSYTGKKIPAHRFYMGLYNLQEVRAHCRSNEGSRIRYFKGYSKHAW